MASPPKKPDVHVTPVPRTPSEWSPRSIPTPGVGRSTADPRTPTLRELAARAAQAGRAALTDQRPPAWVELAYTHPDDDTPMGGAPYRAEFADGSVREGRLGADGTARLDELPPALAGTPVEVTFGEAAAAYQALPSDDAPNPAYAGAEAAFDGTRLVGGALLAARAAGDDGESAADGAGAGAGGFMFASLVRPPAAGVGGRVSGALHAVVDWIWGVLQGDFAEDPSNSQIVAGAVLTMVPIVDQVADVRDVVANLARLRDPAERNDPLSPTYFMLATTAVGVVPVFGSPVKGVLRLAMRNAEAGRDAVFAVLRRLGRGDPEAFVRRHLTPGAVTAYAQRGLGIVQGKISAVLAGLEGAARRLGVTRVVEAVHAFRREFAELMAAARQGVQRAAHTLGERVLAMTRRGSSNTPASGSVNGKVSAQPGAAGPPGGGGGSDDERRRRLAQMQRARAERIREDRLRESIVQAEQRGALDELAPDERAWLEAEPRRKALAVDPDTKSFKVAEARAAIRAETQGVVPPPIRRSGFAELGEGGADYIDGSGVEWDMKDASDLQRIVSTARSGENVLIDGASLTSAQTEALVRAARQQLAGAGSPGRILGVPGR